MVARERYAKAINAISNSVGSRRDAAIREFAQRKILYEERLREAEERYNYAPTNREKYAAEKAIEFINQRIREADANIAYIRRFS